MKNPKGKKKSVLADDLMLSPSELFVDNLQKVTDYYNGIVGMQIIDKSAHSVTLGYDKNPILKLTNKPGLKHDGYPSAGLFHNAIVYKNRAKLAQAVRNILIRAPHLYEGTGDHLVSEAFYFHDPEGNGLELYYDRPKSQWQWSDGRVKMDTLYIDPEQYIASYAGEDAKSDEKHLGHVHLRVGDIQQARKFYVDKLGFDVTFDMETALFLSVGGYHHHIGANTWFSKGAPVRTPALGLAEFDIHLPSKKDLDTLADRLRVHEHKFVESGDKLEVADPWGNKIVFS